MPKFLGRTSWSEFESGILLLCEFNFQGITTSTKTKENDIEYCLYIARSGCDSELVMSQLFQNGQHKFHWNGHAWVLIITRKCSVCRKILAWIERSTSLPIIIYLLESQGSSWKFVVQGANVPPPHAQGNQILIYTPHVQGVIILKYAWRW
jgi:hypothetical protein